MSLATPDKIQTLQRKLYLKAKREPTFRFYALYDKVCRADILAHAYALSKSNGGAAGVDGVQFEDVEAYGRERFLAELRAELQERRYRPDAVLRVMIPKPDGGERPLGIPCIRDRVVQAAAKLVLEPIFEADFTDTAYGYRPGRSAKDAVRMVHRNLKAGFVHVVDADLSKFFDTIPHAELLRSVARRVSDGAVLHLVKMWLKAPIAEENDRGAQTRRRPGNRGTPQGGVLSPLLANIYMRRFLKAWELHGNERKFNSRIVSYADDCAPRRRRNREERYGEIQTGTKAKAGHSQDGPGATSTRLCHAAREMRVGPSEPADRGGFQTTGCCCGSMAAVVSDSEKVEQDSIMCGPGRRTQVNR